MAIKQIDYYGRFTPTGVDDSNAKRFQALAGLADQASEIGFSIASRKAAERGQKAGLEAGVKAAEEGSPIESKKGFFIFYFKFR